MEVESSVPVNVATLRLYMRSGEVKKILPDHSNTPAGHSYCCAMGVKMRVIEAYDEALV